VEDVATVLQRKLQEDDQQAVEPFRLMREYAGCINVTQGAFPAINDQFLSIIENASNMRLMNNIPHCFIDFLQQLTHFSPEQRKRAETLLSERFAFTLESGKAIDKMLYCTFMAYSKNTDEEFKKAFDNLKQYLESSRRSHTVPVQNYLQAIISCDNVKVQSIVDLLFENSLAVFPEPAKISPDLMFEFFRVHCLFQKVPEEFTSIRKIEKIILTEFDSSSIFKLIRVFNKKNVFELRGNGKLFRLLNRALTKIEINNGTVKEMVRAFFKFIQNATQLDNFNNDQKLNQLLTEFLKNEVMIKQSYNDLIFAIEVS